MTMNMTVEMPRVKTCAAKDCAYNGEKQCHARAITMGGIGDHQCDTMFSSGRHSQRSETAGVGACKVVSCKFNEDCECSAESIEVGIEGTQAECLTYKV